MKYVTSICVSCHSKTLSLQYGQHSRLWYRLLEVGICGLLEYTLRDCVIGDVCALRLQLLATLID